MFKPKAGSLGTPEVWINCTRSRKGDKAASWAASGFSDAERAALEETHVWHHTVDLNSGQIKMQLVPRAIHDTLEGGYAHEGGFAVVEWLFGNSILF